MFEQKDIDRFWSKVRIKGEDDCWVWIAGKFSSGYGAFKYGKNNIHAHVFAFMITYDIVLSGMEVIIKHSCNNRSCCNPKHLEDGTQKENVLEGYIAGRKPSNTLLTKEDVRKIRLLGKHFGATEISRMPEWKNKVSRRSISYILNYDSFKKD